MCKRLRKIMTLCIVGALLAQGNSVVYANETSISNDSAICAIKVEDKEDQQTSEKVEETQADKINQVFTEAKNSLKKTVTISVDKVDTEALEKYSIPGPLVPYIRGAVFKIVNDKTIKAEIEYTTWYQASKAYKEPKLYESKISESAKKTLKEAKKVIKELKLEEETSAYAKEKAIHDYIISTAKYSEELNGDIGAAMHGAEGVLLEKDGMCRSYAESMQLFMEMLDVESKIIMGWSKNSYEKHVWNMVKLDDGNWYYVDLTWDEIIPEETGKVRYDYFNVPYRILSEDHEFEEWQVLEPTVEMTYFPYTSITAYCAEEIVDLLKSQLEEGKKEGEVYVSYSTNANVVMELVLRAMEETEVYGKVRVDKKTGKIYSYNIYE